MQQSQAEQTSVQGVAQNTAAPVVNGQPVYSDIALADYMAKRAAQQKFGDAQQTPVGLQETMHAQDMSAQLDAIDTDAAMPAENMVASAQNDGTIGTDQKLNSEFVQNQNNSIVLPQGVKRETFEAAQKLILEMVGDISEDIVIQGSRVAGTARENSDIDIAIRVSLDKFDNLISKSFKTPHKGSAKEKTMLHAIKTGKIQAGEAGLRSLRKELERIFGFEVDISIIKKGGAFDNPPFISIR